MADQTPAHYLPLTVKANFAWNFSGKTVYAASRALILILIAKLGTAAMVGQYALAFAITTPAFMLADLDLRSVLATDTGNQLEFRHYVGLRFCTTVLAMAATCVLALLQAGTQAFAVTLFVGAAKAFETMSDMYFGQLQKHERMNRLGISLMAKGLLSVLATGLVLWLRHSLPEAMAALALAWLLMLVFYDIPSSWAYGSVKPLFDAKRLWGLARLSLPLGLVFLFASLNRNMSNYFVQAYLGSESLGYFSSMLYLVATGSIIASALGQSTNARLARQFAGGDTRGFAKTLGTAAGFLLSAGVCILCVSLAFGKQILTLLYTPDYAAYSGVFAIVMCGACASYVADLTNYAVTATRRFRIQPLIQLGALTAAILLNRLIVPTAGLAGAAWCVAAVSCVQLGGNLAVLIRTLRRKRFEAELRAKDKETMLTLEAVSGWEALTPETTAGWRGILSQNANHEPFSDPDWLQEWWKAFGSNREALFLVLRDGDAISGVLPLACSRKRGAKAVTIMGTPIACPIEPAILPGRTEEAVRLVLDFLMGLGGAALCSLDGLPEGSAFCRAVSARLEALGQPRSAYRAPYYSVETGGQPFEDFYRSRFSSMHIRSARKDEARLALLGDMRFRELTAAEMPGVFALHCKRWSRKLDTSGFCEAESRKFFTSLLESRNAPWRAQALGLFLGSRLIGFQYGFLCAGRYIGYTKAHDDLFGVFRPGGSVLRECIRRCMEAGIGMVELGVGYEEYKLHWADEPQTMLSLAFSPANIPSRLLLFLRSVKDSSTQALKRSHRIVLFKRNTLGRIRYSLSPARLGEAFRRTAESVRRLGLQAYIAARLPSKKAAYRYPVRPNKAALDSLQPGLACLLGPDDAEELALLYLCTPEQIMKRFFIRERCFAVKKGGRIACSAWMAEEKECIVLRHFRADWRACGREDILGVLAAALAAVPKQRRNAVLLELGCADNAVKITAADGGLIRVMPEEEPKNTLKAKEERTAET